VSVAKKCKAPQWRGFGGIIPLDGVGPGGTTPLPGSYDILAGGGQGKFAVFDAPGGDELLGKLLHAFAGAFERQGFQAVVVIQVHVHGAQDEVVILMLDLDEALGQIRGMVVVDQGEHAGHFLVGLLPFLLHEHAPDKIADGLGTGLVAFFLAQRVEFFQQLGVERNAETNGLSHGTPLYSVIS